VEGRLEMIRFADAKAKAGEAGRRRPVDAKTMVGEVGKIIKL